MCVLSVCVRIVVADDVSNGVLSSLVWVPSSMVLWMGYEWGPLSWSAACRMHSAIRREKYFADGVFYFNHSLRYTCQMDNFHVPRGNLAEISLIMVIEWLYNYMQFSTQSHIYIYSTTLCSYMERGNVCVFAYMIALSRCRLVYVTESIFASANYAVCLSGWWLVWSLALPMMISVVVILLVCCKTKVSRYSYVH